MKEREKWIYTFLYKFRKDSQTRAQNLIGLINEYTRNRNHVIGKIDIMKNFSFFEVEKSAEKEILEGFSDSQWNGYQLTVEISKPKNDSGKKRKKNSSSERRRRKGFCGNKRKKSSKRSSGVNVKSFKSRFKDSEIVRKGEKTLGIFSTYNKILQIKTKISHIFKILHVIFI